MGTLVIAKIKSDEQYFLCSPAGSVNPLKSGIGLFGEQLKKICRICPEFKDHPVFDIANMSERDREFFGKPCTDKMLVWSMWYPDCPYGLRMRFCGSYFGLDFARLPADAASIKIDLQSFGIKVK